MTPRPAAPRPAARPAARRAGALAAACAGVLALGACAQLPQARPPAPPAAGERAPLALQPAQAEAVGGGAAAPPPPPPPPPPPRPGAAPVPGDATRTAPRRARSFRGSAHRGPRR